MVNDYRFDSVKSKQTAFRIDDIYLGDIESLLEAYLERLSESEKKVSYWLANQAEAVDISQKPANLELSKTEIWQAIQSLGQRSLVERVEAGERSYFQINSIFKHYIQSQKISTYPPTVNPYLSR